MTAMNVQALTKDAPKSSSPSESQTPSHWEEQSTSATATADEKLDHPQTELQVRILLTKHLLLKCAIAQAECLQIICMMSVAGSSVLHACRCGRPVLPFGEMQRSFSSHPPLQSRERHGLNVMLPECTCIGKAILGQCQASPDSSKYAGTTLR